MLVKLPRISRCDLVGSQRNGLADLSVPLHHNLIRIVYAAFKQMFLRPPVRRR